MLGNLLRYQLASPCQCVPVQQDARRMELCGSVACWHASQNNHGVTAKVQDCWVQNLNFRY